MTNSRTSRFALGAGCPELLVFLASSPFTLPPLPERAEECGERIVDGDPGQEEVQEPLIFLTSAVFTLPPLPERADERNGTVIDGVPVQE